MKQQSQLQQSNFCLNHNKPSIIEDEENIFCIDCIKMVIGNASLITTEQMRWKKQHFLVNALEFADNIHFLYMKLNEQFNNEIETFIQVVEGFRKIIKTVVVNAHSMRQKAYLECFKHVNYKDMETWYYKEQESYHELNKKIQNQITEFQNKTQQLELLIQNISQNHESFYNKEEQIQKERMIQFRNPSIQYNNQYEDLYILMQQINQQIQIQFDQSIFNNSNILVDKMFQKIDYGIKDIIKDIQDINKQEQIINDRQLINDKTMQILQEKVMIDKEIQTEQLRDLEIFSGIYNQQDIHNNQTDQINENSPRINIQEVVGQSKKQVRDDTNDQPKQDVRNISLEIVNDDDKYIQLNQELIKQENNFMEIHQDNNQILTNSIQSKEEVNIQSDVSTINKSQQNEENLNISLQQYQGLQNSVQDLTRIAKQAEIVDNQQSGEISIDQLGADKILIEGNISQVQQSDELIRQNQIIEQKQDIDNSSELINVKGKQLMVDNQIKHRKFQYEKISDNTIKENTQCYSFAFNQDATILFIGRGDKKIKLYEFKNGKIIKEIQTLSNHTESVLCLVFMKKSNSLVSGSQDKSIIIWNQDYNYQWKPQQILQGHTNWINCMVINEDEDLLISGSRDQKIKFWKKVDLSWSCQQTINASFDVYSLSLNTSQTKLISCGSTSDIKVIEHQPDQQWIITQTIKVDQCGYRLCFINDNQFVFQPYNNGFLQIYNYEQEKKQFIQVKQVQIQSCKDYFFYFPCQFIESKNILIVKHGKHVNFFGIDQNGDYILQQSIEFGHEWDLYGRLTDDGQFLITWDYASKEIQVRKLSYLE